VFNRVVKCPLVKGAKRFLTKRSKKMPFFVVSGTPDDEIRRIVNMRKLEPFFKAVYGSPEKKEALIRKILKEHGFNKKDVLFVGDSKDDMDAALASGIIFAGRVTGSNRFTGLKKSLRIRDLTELDRLIDEKKI
jgi:haloacid dehalogenase superfamily, subfamily IA, variant 1 with third motif having Dx(3-4)D or Dx(3-4)E